MINPEKESSSERSSLIPVLSAVLSAISIALVLVFLFMWLSREQEVPPAPSISHAEAPEAPLVDNPQSTTISAPQEVVELFSNDDSADAWFIEQLKSVNISGSSGNMLSIRDDVCDSLGDGLVPASMLLDEKGFSSKQKGVIIASSMASLCDDVEIDIDTRLVPETE